MTATKQRKTAHIVDTVAALQTQVNGKSDNNHNHVISDITNLNTELNNLSTEVAAKIPTSEKGAASGVATLDASGIIPSAQLPSFVDDVMEYTNLSSFPSTGEADKIYVDLSNGRVYRWGGTQYVEIAPGGPNADTAVRLFTARTVGITGDGTGSVSFDGSANVNIPLTIADDSHNHVISNIDGLQSALDGKAASNHNHDSDYAAINHNHDTTYAGVNHNHDSDYAAINHNHDSDYAAANHTHAVASSSSNGFMSSTHAVRVNNMRENAGAGLTKDSSQRFAHGDTSSVSDANNSGATVIQDIGFDTYGHVQSYGSVEITTSLIGAAAANHNHDSDYAAINHNHDSSYAAANHTHDLSDINVDAGLNMSSNSITGVTSLSSNNLVLATGGTLTSSANWSQGGSSEFTGGVTITDAALTVESDTLSSTVPSININALDQGSGTVDRGFSLAFDSSDSRKFDIFFPDTDSNGGKRKVIHQDDNGDVYIQPKGEADRLRLTQNGYMQFGFNASTNASTLNGSSTTDTGVQIADTGWIAIAGSTARVIDLNRRSTTGIAISFRSNGGAAGSLSYDSSNHIQLVQPSDQRIKTDEQDMTGALDAISTLSPKTYRLVGGGDTRHAGLIAQEVEQLTNFGEAVSQCATDEYADMRHMNYSFFIPHLIAALKEASAKITALETRISTLEAQ